MINTYWDVIKSNLIECVNNNYNLKPNLDNPFCYNDLNKINIDLKMLKRNVLDNNISGPFKCENCNYKTNRKSSYNSHLNNKNGCKQPLFCMFCDRKYLINQHLKKHEKKCQNRLKRKCKHCKKIFTRLYGLKQHLKVCPKNSTTFKPNDTSTKKNSNNISENVSKLNEENNKSSISYKYLCWFCDLPFEKQDMKNHIEICSKNTQNKNGDGDGTVNNTTIDNSTTINNNNNNNTTNINNTTINLISNISVLNFGSENVSFLSEKKLKQCFFDPKNSIGKLLKFIHYNKNHP